jgi:hypothetical protein
VLLQQPSRTIELALVWIRDMREWGLSACCVPLAVLCRLSKNVKRETSFASLR